jgi:type IV pilus assembly protein PilQ
MMNKRMLSSLVIVALLTLSSVAFGAGTTSILPGALLNGPRHAPAPESRASDTPQGASPAASSSSGYAFTLVSLKQETVGGSSRILVESSTPPLYTVMRPNDQLIVIDLPGADGSKLLRQYAIDNAMIERITVRDAASNFSGGSAAAGSATGRATRIEIGVKGRLKDRSMLDGNTLVLELSAEDGATSAADQSNATATAQARLNRDLSTNQAQPGTRPLDARKTSAGSGRSDVYVYPESVKGDAQPVSGSPLRQATTLRSVRAEASQQGTRILVDADGLAQYKDFTLTNPSRIVVDFQGVRSEFGNKTLNVDGGPVERVRVGQPGPNTVRVVIDSKSKLPYNIARQGASLVIAVGDASAAIPATVNSATVNSTTVHQTEGRPSQGSSSEPGSQASSSVAAKVTAAGSSARPQGTDSRAAVSNATASKTAGQADAKATATASQLNSTSGPSSQARQQAGLRQAGDKGVGGLQATLISGTGSATDGAATQVQNGQVVRPRQKGEVPLCDPGYVGGPISFDLRAGVDIRDMLRFISQQYGVNFVMDKSVGTVPVELKITEVPWNRVMESVLKANGLAAVCDDGGKIVRVATLQAIEAEQKMQTLISDERDKAKPLQTWIRHMKYARVTGGLGAGSGRSTTSQGIANQIVVPSGSNSNNTSSGSWLQIVGSRLSKRGRVEIDARTNSLIVTDLAENIQVIQQMIDLLDRPEPQVEIEARIVVASHNFLRDLGVQLTSAAQNVNNGAAAILQTATTTLVPRGTSAASGQQTPPGIGASQGVTTTGIGNGLPFQPATNDLRGAANTVLGLTTGVFGTNIISAALAASETKGQIRTIATPRITAQDNQRAEIVNGVQIPVQTISNNTVATTFITAALRLELTPQIIEENGEVLMHIVAENNTVNTALANAANGGTPGINTQSADSIVRVKDGGTAVMGGINIDTESNTQNRTPGVSRVPLLGELFKRRTVSRNADEILFFVTPRIIRSEGDEHRIREVSNSASPVTSPENKSIASPVSPATAAPATAAVASSGSGK